MYIYIYVNNLYTYMCVISPSSPIGMACTRLCTRSSSGSLGSTAAPTSSCRLASCVPRNELHAGDVELPSHSKKQNKACTENE